MNMLCANPDCKAELKYLRGGRLYLMERQPHAADPMAARVQEPKRPVMMRRYFWLCEDCASSYAIQRWTDAGIELSPRKTVKRMPISVPQTSADWAVPGLVG